jgi:ADP-glucose pyrophosphorylase
LTQLKEKKNQKSVIQESLLLQSLEDFPYVSLSSVLFSHSHLTHNLESSETLIAQYKEQMPTFLFYCGSRASDYGLMKINEEGQVLFFKEKPKGAELQAMVQAWFLFTLL